MYKHYLLSDKNLFIGFFNIM